MDVAVEKPVLERVPPFDDSGLSPEQRSSLTAVFEAYNTNLLRLVDYSQKLLDMQDTLIEYYEEALRVVD